ncbi:hypothetical protein [Pseudomonas sp. ML96]|uniref:hypothetical protein n=1 Tax=Pseudomonas sp. ML96 TaxID=1523503 RepID=UPI00068F3D5A|nr:hypothetical protein [Pseudomonas sp. ML96]
MSFAIPAATSITSLFVIKTDFYTNKETGEVRASVQALSPIPEGANGNGKGYEVTEYAADASVLDAIDLSNGPTSLKFESQIRPITNRFGKTTNTQVLTKALVEQPRQQQQQPSKPAAQAEPKV